MAKAEQDAKDAIKNAKALEKAAKAEQKKAEADAKKAVLDKAKAKKKKEKAEAQAAKAKAALKQGIYEMEFLVRVSNMLNADKLAKLKPMSQEALIKELVKYLPPKKKALNTIYSLRQRNVGGQTDRSKFAAVLLDAVAK